jgi:hypothetical protein
MVANELSPGAIAAALKKADMGRCRDRREAVARYRGEGLEAEVRSFFRPKALAQISVDAQRIARRFIDKRYSVYQAAPTRATTREDYAGRQGNLDAIMVWVERLSGVLGTVGLIVTVTEAETLHHIPLVEFEPIFTPDDPEPYGVAYPLFSSKPDARPEDLTWIVWTDDLHFQVSGGTAQAIVGPGGEVNADMRNPYGTCPVVFVHREPDLGGAWWRPMAHDLLGGQRTYNVLGVQGNLGAMFQALGQEVIIGVSDAKDIKRGVDEGIVLPVGAEYHMEGPPGGLDTIQEWQRWKLDSLAASMALKIKWADGSGGATSGEHQRMLELELTTSIMGDFELWRVVEAERHRIARAVYKHHFGVDLGEDLSVNFTEPNVPQSPEEMRVEWEFEMEHGMASVQDYFRRKDPSATREQIDAQLARVAEERAAFAPKGKGSSAPSGLAALLNGPVA